MGLDCMYWDWCLYRNIGGSRTWSHVTSIKMTELMWTLIINFLPAHYLRTRSSHNQKLQIQFCLLYLRRIHFLFLLLFFLLRILFCLKIFVPVLQPWLLIANALVVLVTAFSFVFEISLHTSSASCSHPFHPLVVNKIF